MTWAQRLRRAFGIEIQTCQVCGGRSRSSRDLEADSCSPPSASPVECRESLISRRQVGFRVNGFRGTFRDAQAAVDAFFRIDHEEVLTLVEAVRGPKRNGVLLLQLMQFSITTKVMDAFRTCQVVADSLESGRQILGVNRRVTSATIRRSGRDGLNRVYAVHSAKLRCLLRARRGWRAVVTCIKQQLANTPSALRSKRG